MVIQYSQSWGVRSVLSQSDESYSALSPVVHVDIALSRNTNTNWGGGGMFMQWMRYPSPRCQDMGLTPGPGFKGVKFVVTCQYLIVFSAESGQQLVCNGFLHPLNFLS